MVSYPIGGKEKNLIPICSRRICPIFQVSNVTGENLGLLRQFLNLLTTRVYYDENDSAEFQIDDTYTVPGTAICYRKVKRHSPCRSVSLNDSQLAKTQMRYGWLVNSLLMFQAIFKKKSTCPHFAD